MSSPPSEKKEVVMVPIDSILIPEDRVTSVLEDEILDELVESIKQHGILQPLQLAKVGDKLVLIDGLHRLAAARSLGMKEVPCIIQEMDEKQLLITNLIVNRQRGKSNPADEARILKKLVDEYGMDFDEAASKLGMSRSTADKYYRIAKYCSNKVLEALGAGQISVGCAYWISFVDDKEKQNEIVDLAITWRYSVEQCKAAAAAASQAIPAETTKFIITPEGMPKPKPISVYPCGKEVDPSEVVVIQIDAKAWDVVQQAFQELCREGFFYPEDRGSPSEESTPPSPTEEPQPTQYGEQPPAQETSPKRERRDWFLELLQTRKE